MVVMIQQVYPNSHYLSMLDVTFSRHARFCGIHGIDYQLYVQGEKPELGGWEKLYLIQEALKKNELVIYLDADVVIRDMTANVKSVLNELDTIGAVRFPVPVPHWNVGVLFFRKGERVARFLDEWIAAFPGPVHWREQQVFQDLGEKYPIIQTLPDTWNSSVEHNWTPNNIISAFHGEPFRQQELAKVIRDNPA